MHRGVQMHVVWTIKISLRSSAEKTEEQRFVGAVMNSTQSIRSDAQ